MKKPTSKRLLDFMCEFSAYIEWSNDGETCRLVFPNGRDNEAGGTPYCDDQWFGEHRAAIAHHMT